MQQDQQPGQQRRAQQDGDEKNPEMLALERLNRASRRQVFQFIIVQVLLTLVLSAALLFFDRVVAYSSLMGGLIATLANAWFAVKVFRVKSIVTAEALLSTMYIGETFKLVFTGAMFVMAFVLVTPISIVALLLTYLFIHMTPAVHNVFTKA